MSDQPTFSLAVVKGRSVEKTHRSARKRISVGSARDNDLVLTDPQIAPRHFLVLIDGPRWRVHALTDAPVNVDKRWSHPAEGKRGAILETGGVEILLYPGDLDAHTIAREVRARRGGGEDAAEMATSVAVPKPLALEDPEPAAEPTVAVPPIAPAAPNPTTDRRRRAPAGTVPTQGADDMDLVEMAQMPTLAGERPPDELREAAQQMLEKRRGPVAPSVLRETSPGSVPPIVRPVPESEPFDADLSNATVLGLDAQAPKADERTVGVAWVDGKPQLTGAGAGSDATGPVPAPPSGRSSKPKSGNRWERARQPSLQPKPDERLPEILAEPESQMMRAPGATKSVMSERPDFAQPTAEVAPAADVIPIETSRPAPKRNAWGDGGGRASQPPGANRALVPTRDTGKRNAWGDTPRGEKKKRAGWGDGARGRGPDPAPSGGGPTPDPKRNSALTPRETPMGPRLDLGRLVGRNEPALELLDHPDGAYATQVRLLGAKIEEYARNLGYRAYMVSSPEALAGKTTAAVNLALALAEDTQRRVALVEANFRYPRFAEVFGIDERTGIISVLEGRARLNEVGFKVADRNLVVLPTGGRHPAPAEVLAAPRFKAMLSELVDTVDIAIVDAPAVNSIADTNLILPLVDAAFMVVAEGQTKRSWLAQASDQLGERRILGSLFTRMPKKTRRTLKKARKMRAKA